MSDEKIPMRTKSGSITHGLYARDVLMPWDDREEFEALHEELRKEDLPIGASEEQCVLDLALAYWHKQTIWRLRAATVLRDPFTQEIVDTEKKSWGAIRVSLRKMASEERSLKEVMEAGAADMVDVMSRLTRKLAKELSPADAKQLVAQLSSAVDLFNNKMMPLFEKGRQLPDAEGSFDKHYLPEDLERVMRLETAIDARITKLLARLVAIKEFKRTPAGSPIARLTAS
jgi:hypothetical protein